MRFFVILASVAAAVAQLTINTPQGVLACTNQQVTWSGGTGPYILQVQPGGDTSAAALETFTGIAASPYTWAVTQAANTEVFLRLHDNSGLIAETATFTIQSAGSTTCAPGVTSSVAVTTGAATTSGAATTPATTTAAAATTTAAAGTTTPAAGAGTTTPAPGTTTGASHTTSSTTTSHTGGAAPLQIAGGLVGLVGAVAVALA